MTEKVDHMAENQKKKREKQQSYNLIKLQIYNVTLKFRVISQKLLRNYNSHVQEKR